MDSDQNATIAYYDEQAELWAENRTASFWRTEIKRLKELVPAGGRLLDVGCGVGAEAGELAENFDYTGIDLSAKSLEVARRNHPSLQFLQQSLYELPFEDGSFEVLWSAATYIHVPKSKLGTALSEAQRVLVSGATAFLFFREGKEEGMVEQVSYGRPSRRFIAYLQELGEALVEAGFSVVDLYSKPASKPGYPNHLAAFVHL